MNTLISMSKKLIITITLAVSGILFTAQASAPHRSSSKKALVPYKPAARSSAQLKEEHDAEIVTPEASRPAKPLKSASKQDSRVAQLRIELFTNLKKLLDLKHIQVRDIINNIENQEFQAALSDLLSLIFKEYTQRKYYTNGARLSPDDMQKIIDFNQKMVQLYVNKKGSITIEFTMNVETALLSLSEIVGLEDTLLKICNLIEHNELKRCNKAVVTILKFTDAKKLQSKKIPAPKAVASITTAAHKPVAASKPQPKVSRPSSAFHTAAASAYAAEEPDLSSSIVEDKAAAERRKQQEFYAKAMANAANKPKESKPKNGWTSSAYAGKTVEQLEEEVRLEREKTKEMELKHQREMERLRTVADFQTAANQTEMRVMAAMHRTEVATVKAMIGSPKPARSTSTAAASATAAAKKATPSRTSSAASAVSKPNYDGILSDLYAERRRQERLIAKSPNGALGLTMGTQRLNDVKADIKRYEALNRSIARTPATASLTASEKADIKRIAGQIAEERFAPFREKEELLSLQRKTKALIMQLPTIKPAQLAKLPGKLKDRTFIANLQRASEMLTEALVQCPHTQLNLLNQLLKVLTSNNKLHIATAMQKLQNMPDTQAKAAAQKLTGLLESMTIDELTVINQALTTIFA